MGKVAKWRGCQAAKAISAAFLFCMLGGAMGGLSACQSPFTTPTSSAPIVIATRAALPTVSPVATPISSTLAISGTPSSIATTLQVSLDKLCIYQTGESIAFSRADIYFSFRLYEPNGISHTIHEVAQPDLIKHAADPTCSAPLLFGSQQTLAIQHKEGSCLRIEGEFWNASRLSEDALVGRINEQVCYHRGEWLPVGAQARHLTGGGADWEVSFTIQQLSD